ncbi:hypothetical protein CAPTEDRAFT_205609 [Capitella teleta]|uniref:Major facilitator superfamily (MFS) profile domain-containing protein n=1 Tax=Capitella teleta TaxID=283909 RepID=R7U485_CAPTE|nr:hypothetical protein CAPTEDRAFT_205609 [Capitella teleta]|eukprot:ELT98491.1 hypothetical protein CAPTEDRAFT_205609 [Capitella teleta]
MPDGVVPDGGYGWVVVFASFLLQTLTKGITYTFGVVFVDMLAVFGSSASTTAWIGSIQAALLNFTGILSGPLIQRFGWRKVTIAGSFLSASGFALSAAAPNVYILYLTYGVMTGLGNGLMFLTSMVAVQHYFDRRRSLATGIAVSGSGVGTLTFGLLSRALLDGVGFQMTMIIQGSIMLLGVISGALLRPLEVTALEVDFGPGEVERSKSVQSTLTDAEELDEANRCSNCIDLSLFKSPIFCLFGIGVLGFCLGYHVPFTYIPERARQFGVDAQSASFLISIVGIANVASRLVIGWMADHSPTIRFYLAGVTLTLGGVSSILIPYMTTYPLMIMYSALFGMFSGIWSSLFPVILVDLLGVAVIERSLGQVLAVGSIAFLLASPMSVLPSKVSRIPGIAIGAGSADIEETLVAVNVTVTRVIDSIFGRFFVFFFFITNIYFVHYIMHIYHVTTNKAPPQ